MQQCHNNSCVQSTQLHLLPRTVNSKQEQKILKHYKEKSWTSVTDHMMLKSVRQTTTIVITIATNIIIIIIIIILLCSLSEILHYH